MPGWLRVSSDEQHRHGTWQLLPAPRRGSHSDHDSSIEGTAIPVVNTTRLASSAELVADRVATQASYNDMHQK
jgi:hypothetical protein